MPRGVKRPVDVVISSDDEDYSQSHWVPTPKAPYSSYAGPSGSASTSYHHDAGSHRDPIVIPDSPPPVRVAPRPRPPAARPPIARLPVTPPSIIPPPQVPSPVAPPAKRQRKQKDPNGESTQAPEKRLAIFKKKCPQAIRERAERVATQRYTL